MATYEVSGLIPAIPLITPNAPVGYSPQQTLKLVEPSSQSSQSSLSLTSLWED